MTSRLAYLALPCALLLGCSNVGDTGEPGEDAPGEEEADRITGRYEITSHYDLSQAEGATGEAIGLLTGLSEDPAGTLIALVEATDLLEDVPDVIVDQVTAWINDHLAEQLYEGVPVTEEIARWADTIATVLTDFEVISTLELADEGGGAGLADHLPTAVAFELDGSRRVIDAPDLVNQLGVARDVSCQISQTGDAPQITIGDHAFNLPLGDFAVVAMNQAIAAHFDVADLRGALGLLIDCGQVTAEVVERCGSFCATYETQIAAMCATGLDQAAAKLEAAIASIDYAELSLAAGKGVLLDGKQDGIDGPFDAIEQGSWQAGFDVDGVAIAVPATFVGRRAE